ncbi:Pentatricopeptide repeat-containing protein At1g34160 [Linum perenne]
MLRGSHKVDALTCSFVLKACARVLALSESIQLHSQIVRRGFIADALLGTTLLDLYAKGGEIRSARKVFDEMSKRDIASWNALISGLAQGTSGMNPDEVSYLAAICACNHAGLVDEGVKHYGSVVDLLGRAGRLQQAFDVINSMPIVPDMVLWQTLLGACKTYRNVEMAETVTRKLVEMGSKSDGNFVLLSNIYASHERWGDVGRVRQVMKNKDVRKIPGFSYIEEKGEIHKFYNGDKSHDNWKKIYAKLEEIRFKMKEFGYVAETSFVLHDIGDEEKENALYQHSEKLAVAYGLVCANDEDGTPIQVIKNLRICGDCHVVMKLVSKMYNREIIVRDRVRFHRFKDGICSCRDYW